MDPELKVKDALELVQDTDNLPVSGDKERASESKQEKALAGVNEGETSNSEQPDGTVISATQPDPLIDSIIDGKYKVFALVGRGGMGVLYRGEHQGLNKPVAIKILSKRAIETDEAYLRFRQEAKLAAKLEHPAIAPVTDCGILSDGRSYMIMNLLQGQTLSSILQEEKRLSAERAIRLVEQICDALAHAHEQGVVHRDLKPSNIMVRQEGEGEKATLFDFGIAKGLLDDSQKLTTTHEVIGSPLYMSPEQCASNPIDARADLYSLGCVMYECLTGEPPFYAPTAVQTLFMHTYQEPRAISAVAPNINFPDGLEAVVMKCLAKDPAARFKDASELRAALKAVLVCSPVKIRTPCSLRKKKIALVMTMAAAVLLLIGAVVCKDLVKVRPELLSDPGPAIATLLADLCSGRSAFERYNADDAAPTRFDLGGGSKGVYLIDVQQAHDQPRSKDNDANYMGHIKVDVSSNATVLILFSNAPMHWTIAGRTAGLQKVYVRSAYSPCLVAGVPPQIVEVLGSELSPPYNPNESEAAQFCKGLESTLPVLKEHPVNVMLYANQVRQVEIKE